MKLYVTPGSPYARMVRIVVLEKGLESQVEIVGAQTRVTDSPYYAINPSGRVPFLLRDDGIGMEESALICTYLDELNGDPVLRPSGGRDAWEARRLEALARSLLDGLAVWARETARPETERSPRVILHERARAQRMTDLWETAIDGASIHGGLDMGQITLACALDLEGRIPDFGWRSGHPRLDAWFGRIAARPSFRATATRPA
ncbi:MAG: hypothetical protein GC151_14715 [Betaproteobacteria bacterium]|nr:hypothetical protein [Betaproteobacteria bacterium]